MNGLPLVSIIIPVYKAEDYISKCIESLQQQTYPNIEIILIEDASPDSSGCICDNYAKEDCRIKVIHHEHNQGVSCTRNDGLTVAEGAYIGFVDGDDYVSHTYVEDCVQAIQTHNADAVIFNISIVKGGRINPVSMNPSLLKDRDTVYRALIEDTIPNYLCNKFFKRFVWESIRLQENTDFEDLLIMPLVFKNITSVYYLNKSLYFYNCDNENSITSNWSSKSKYGLFCSYLYRQPLADEIGLHSFSEYCRYRAIRSAVSGIGLDFARPELHTEQIYHMMNYLRHEELAQDRPFIGFKYRLLLYGALHAPWISKLYGHAMYILESIKK
ncbi:glycosyltransferase family 2 protein [Veillonella denticariosi]|uniref:glycosyltransferase family 2 protein n=1 Tax=Veillonella denticariosi TaxID=419208 RepID=UPI002491BE28|nr:glycosyltransferase family 2 protein [Veillonella denticariosi]